MLMPTNNQGGGGGGWFQSPPQPPQQRKRTAELLRILYDINVKTLKELRYPYSFDTQDSYKCLIYQSQAILGMLKTHPNPECFVVHVKKMDDLLNAIANDPPYLSFACAIKKLVDQMKAIANFYKDYPQPHSQYPQPPLQQLFFPKPPQYSPRPPQQPYSPQPPLQYSQPSPQYPKYFHQPPQYAPQPPQQPYSPPAPANPNLKYSWGEDEISSIPGIHTKDVALSKFKGKCWDIPGWAKAYELPCDDEVDDPKDERNNRGVYVLAAAYTNMLLPPLEDVLKQGGKVLPVQQRSFMQITLDGNPAAEVVTPPLLYAAAPRRYTEIADCRGIRRQYSQTEVYVVNGDTLDVTLGLKRAFPGERIAVLNMTDPSRPGGWWEKGRLSQEETLFVRTALSRALSPSYYPLGDFTAIYAREVAVLRGSHEYGYPFLSKDDLWFVDFVSVAGVNLWIKKKSVMKGFTERTGFTVREKVEAILAACAANKAEVLVLGALGCGAFGNPPRDVAAIFKAVLEQYAGFFKEVVFAIYDDSSDEKTIRPFAETLLGEKYQEGMSLAAETESEAFQDLIKRMPHEGMKQPSPEWRMPPPYAGLEPCSAYGMCTNPDPAHYAKEAHPPMCPRGRDCRDDSYPHRLMFMHVERCPKWGLCDILYSSDIAAVRAHLEHFDHPRINSPGSCGVPEFIPILSENDGDAGAGAGAGATVSGGVMAELRKALAGLYFCPDAGLCTNTSKEHLETCIHLPVCSGGLLCEERGNEAHRKGFRHLPTECPDGKHCTRCFTDPQHWAVAKHPFAEPCPCAPYPCGKEDDPEHSRRYSHMCKYGPRCENTDPEHLRMYFHGPLSMVCPNGSKCNDMSEEHLAAFFHDKDDEPPHKRPPCKKGLRCTNTNANHIRKFSHTAAGLENSPARSHNMRDPQPTKDAYGVWNQKDYPVNFVRNTEEWLSHFPPGSEFHPDPAGANFRAVVKWISGFRPVHMLSAETLLSVAELGALTSLERLRSIWTETRTLVACVLARETVVPHLRKIEGSNDLRKKVRKFLALYIRTLQAERVEKNANKYTSELTRLTGLSPAEFKENEEKNTKDLANYKFAIDLYNVTVKLAPGKANDLPHHRTDIINSYDVVEEGKGKSFVEMLEAEARATVDALHDLFDPKGSACIGSKGFSGDTIVRTNYTVFAVVGPHLDNYGGADAALILDEAIMYHPDYYMLPNAATLYGMGHYHRAKYGTGSLMDRTPWMGPSKPFDAEGGGRDSLRTEKFHPIATRWVEAAASEFMARTMCSLRSANTPVASIDDVTLDQVIKYWEGCNSHCVIEGHLPASVPLSYVARAIIQESTRAKLAANPTGAALLAKWEAAKILQVVASANDVRMKNEAYFTKPRPLAAPLTGFTFALAGETSNEAFIPLELPLERNHFAVRFAAQGLPFRVAFSNVGDLKGPLKARNLDPKKDESYCPRHAVTFSLDISGQLLTGHRVPPGACLTSNFYGKVMGFSDHTPCRIAAEGAKVTEPVYYEVRFDYEEKVITFRHWGPSAVFNALELKVEMDPRIFAEKKGLDRYSYVSFANSSSENYLAAPPVIISNLNVYFDK